MKPATPPLQSARLLGQVQERAGYLHYSPEPGKDYFYEMRFYIAGSLHKRQVGATRATWR